MQLRARGHSPRNIARVLNEEQIPTALGVGPWRKSSVESAIRSRDFRALAEVLGLDVDALIQGRVATASAEGIDAPPT